MKQAEDTRTAELPELDDDAQTWPRSCTLYCRACRKTARGVLVQRYEGPPPCSRCGELRPAIIEEVPAALVVSKTGKRNPRGAYAGAVKIGAGNQASRARTKLSQAEFAGLACVSERTLRTWERGDTVSPASVAAIRQALAKLGHDPGPAQRRPVRYRCPMTGDTWSGRGLMPRWLRVKLADGARLADFELGAATDPHRATLNAAAQRAARAVGLA